MKSLLFSDIKRFMKRTLNKIYILQFLIVILLTVLVVRQEVITRSIERKIDYRYFNITRSLEGIHNVEIDTRGGKVEHKYPVP